MTAKHLDAHYIKAAFDLSVRFSEMTGVEFDKIAALFSLAKLVELEANQTILRENEKNNLVYFLVAGELELTKNNVLVLRLNGFGEVVGEISATFNQPCPDTVRTNSLVQLLVLDLRFIFGHTDHTLHETTLLKILCAGLELRLRQSHDRTREYFETKNLLSLMAMQLQEAKSTLKQTKADKTLDLANKKILICEEQKKFHSSIRSSLMGSGAKIYLTEQLSEAMQSLENEDYDAVVASPTSLDLLRLAKKKFPLVKTILSSPLENGEITRILTEENFIDNVHLTQEVDRTHFIKTLTTTLHKMLQKDIFGPEKYLHSGAEIHSFAVTSSFDRAFLKERLESFLKELNVRSTVADRCLTVCDELLMNAIFDAPTHKDGKSKFNHLSRTEHVELQPQEQGQFFFACDGITVLVGIHDPFGALEKDTFIKYLNHNYNQSGSPFEGEKGGGGHGFHLMVETSDMLIVNVKRQWKSEVIALFSMPAGAGKEKVPNRFQLFFED